MFRRLLAAVGLSSPDSTATSAAPTAGAELSASAIVAETVTGSHVLTIHGYSQTKDLLGTGQCVSSGMFTVAGHRWVVEYYPNGDSPANADWVSVYLKLERRSTDVKARVRLSLLDKDGEPVPSYWYPRRTGVLPATSYTANKLSWGVPIFITRKALEASDYLIRDDDCFRIRCDVTVLKEVRTEDRDAGAIVVPPPDLGRHLGHLLDGGEGADVTFEVAGKTFPAHRYILAARSPVFMAELFGSMKEKSTTSVRIEDMEARVFKALLHFIYTDSLPEIDEEEDVTVMSQHLLVAADRYSMERMKLICEEKLRGYIDVTTVGTTLALAEQHGCHGLKKACFQFLMSRSNLKAAMATDGFSHLTSSCPPVLYELLAKVTL
ncbi:hypothetical protein EJB05_26579, partial [Eragrostis curvula]